jgi:flagellar basal body-associated protein FliL
MAYRGKSKLGRIDQEDEMTYDFSKRSIIIFIIVMIAATALTVEGTYYVLEKFVFKDANDPIVKAGGLTPVQKEVGKAQ